MLTVSVLLGIAACKSDPVAGSPALGLADAGAAAEDAAVAEDAEAPGACPGPTPESYPWKSPRAADPTACDEADLEALSAVKANKSGLTESEITNALGTRCAACAVGQVGDDTWRAVVSGHAGYIGNVGGCVVRLGATEACGRATDEVSTCLIVGCAGCASRKEQDACSDALTTVDGPCAPALKTLRTACTPKIITAAFSSAGACQSFIETIRLFCGPPAAADAGTD